MRSAWSCGFAILRYGTRAEPAVEPATLLAGRRPLLAKAVTVTRAGAAALFVFAVGAGLGHRGSLFDLMAAFITRVVVQVNPWPKPILKARRHGDSAMVFPKTGKLLLGATDQRFAACFHDGQQNLIEQEVATRVGQRVFGIERAKKAVDVRSWELISWTLKGRVSPIACRYH
jgi:hypothetical protein